MYGISGILSKTNMGAVGGKKQEEDPSVKATKKQIAQTKEQMQQVKANQGLDEQTKKAKLKTLQDKLTELNKQLVTQQAQSQSKVEEAEEKSPMNAIQESQKQVAKNRDTVELSMPKGMGALISASTSMQQMEAMSSIKTHLKGRVAVVKSEIELDSMNGGSTDAKAAELGELEGALKGIDASMAKKNAEVNDEMKKSEDKDTVKDMKEQVQSKKEEEEEQQKTEKENQEE